jgi:hypothetical protein
MDGNKIGDFRRKIYKFYEQDILNEKQYQELLDSFEAAISVTRCCTEVCEICKKPKEPEAEKYCHHCNGIESI